jgi:hypothetical protein
VQTPILAFAVEEIQTVDAVDDSGAFYGSRRKFLAGERLLSPSIGTAGAKRWHDLSRSENARA